MNNSGDTIYQTRLNGFFMTSYCLYVDRFNDYQVRVWGCASVAPLVLLLVGCSPYKSERKSESQHEVASRAQVIRFCGDCHAYPKPETFPRSRWREEVVQGFRFYKESGRNDLDPPTVDAIVAYYEAAADVDMWVDLPDPAKVSQGPRRFVEEPIHHIKVDKPGVSHIKYVEGDDSEPHGLLVSDMQAGLVTKLIIRDRTADLEIIDVASIPNPAHVMSADLNADGVEEWLVADLGSFVPADHNLGNILQLNFNGDTRRYDVEPILKNVPRVADTRVADLDGDGDQDIVAGIFGWRSTGRLTWLEQQKFQDSSPEFKLHQIDPRHGCSHSPLVDIDGDGDVDIVALFSQEHETVVLFLNDGAGEFSKQTVYEANDPSWGSSSLELTDLDGDGDLDIVLTNGDSFDSHLIKPYHSVQWLEQTGDLEFAAHHLANLPGAYCAKAGDIDQDGLTDIVACAMPQNFEASFNSLIWLKQKPDHSFIQYEIETSIAQHACLELCDLDRDGDLDIAVGHYAVDAQRGAPWISIWWNETKEESEE